MSSDSAPPAAPQPTSSNNEHESVTPYLSLRGITKRFPGVVANDNIDLDVYAGEVQAILGENGAGKSTLMKILFGYYRPDAGTISLEGVPINIRSPREGRQHGIGMVFQNFTLVGALTVSENVALALKNLPAILPRRELARDIKALSERYRFGIDPRTRVRDLSIGEQQKVEILKLLAAKAKILVFDEPTSVLAPHEIDELMGVFRQLRDDKLAVLFITHKLREVLAVADRITVLRRGTVVASMPAKGATERSLVSLMLGSSSDSVMQANASGELLGSRETPASPPPVPDDKSADVPALEIHGADVPDPAGRVHLHDISLTIHPGEIVGIAAVSGNGQTELGDLVLGLRHCRSGYMRIRGVDAPRWSPSRVLELGVGCVPEDPLRLGTVPKMSIVENMILSERKQYAGWGGLSVRWSVARAHVEKALQRFSLRIPALDTPVGTLSGGNVQRVVFARELARQPTLLVSYYPTRGMDVPSANAARDMLRAHRATEAAILLVSEDLDELFDLSDWLVVMHRGRVAGTFRPRDTNAHAVGILMTGAGGHSG